MKKLQKFKVVLENGKQKSKDKEGVSKNIVDSVADNLVIDSGQLLKSAKDSKGVKVIELWEELKTTKPKEDK